MTAAGTGYRYAFGVFVLVVDVLVFVSAHILLYTRREYQPIKSWDPKILLLMPYSLILSACWAPAREVWGDDLWTAGQVLWFLLGSGAVFATGLMLPARRLVLLGRAERAKIAYARGLIPIGSVVAPPTPGRLLTEAVLFLIPFFVAPAIFLAYDTSADWSNHHFSYWNYG
jgi:hypothetical protein